jgi:3-dehydroquinate synthetase
MPTTLLAIIDSSVGGKVGVDTKYGKNLIGAFYQPRAVIADLSFVSTLSEVQVVNGLMEAVKKFLTSDKPSLALALKLDTKRPLKNPKLLQDIVYRSVRSKARVVMMDEEEKNKRRILSFGHTVGHAVEFLSGYALPHGFAISYGMLVEAKVSEFSGILSAKDFAFVAAFLRHFGFRSKVLRKYPVTKVLKVIRGDKKVRRGVPHYVLLASIGSIYKKGGQYAHPVSDRIVRRAYETLIGE